MVRGVCRCSWPHSLPELSQVCCVLGVWPQEWGVCLWAHGPRRELSAGVHGERPGGPCRGRCATQRLQREDPLPPTVQFSLNLQEGERLRFQGNLVF